MPEILSPSNIVYMCVCVYGDYYKNSTHDCRWQLAYFYSKIKSNGIKTKPGSLDSWDPSGISKVLTGSAWLTTKLT